MGSVSFFYCGETRKKMSSLFAVDSYFVWAWYKRKLFGLKGVFVTSLTILSNSRQDSFYGFDFPTLLSLNSLWFCPIDLSRFDVIFIVHERQTIWN